MSSQISLESLLWIDRVTCCRRCGSDDRTKDSGTWQFFGDYRRRDTAQRSEDDSLYKPICGQFDDISEARAFIQQHESKGARVSCASGASTDLG